jgi:hypothetical protein
VDHREQLTGTGPSHGHALGDSAITDGRARMNRPEDADVLRDALLLVEPTGIAGPDCLDDETIAALAEGSMPGAIGHLATCSHCRRAVGSVARALADPGIAAEIAPVAAGRRRFPFKLVVPFAAAAALLLMVRLDWRQATPPSPHRAPTITASAAPLPLAPLGSVTGPGALRWSSISAADRYRVTLFDGSGRTAFEAQVADTVLALPDSIGLVAGQAYWWKVEARIGRDRWVASDLVDFTISRGVSR